MKPEDIPDDIWEAALTCAGTVCRNLPEDYGDLTIEVTAIARFLLAERLKERERIAEVADALADSHDAEAIAADEEVDVVEHRAAERALRQFAAAIRSRP